MKEIKQREVERLQFKTVEELKTKNAELREMRDFEKINAEVLEQFLNDAVMKSDNVEESMEIEEAMLPRLKKSLCLKELEWSVLMSAQREDRKNIRKLRKKPKS